MKLRALLVLVIAFLILPQLTGCTSQPAAPKEEPAQEKPNIVFILADDLGWHQLGSYGSEFYETPELDQLVQQGMRFTDAYAAAPVCSPTRGSIMTGKYPGRTHVTVNIPTGRSPEQPLVTPEFADWLPLEEVTIAELLKEAGYATGHFGKWHLNKDKKYSLDRPGDPKSQGFEDVLTTHKPGAGPESRYQEDWHHVREITEHAVAFMEKNKDRPFFCYVTHNSIHRPEIEKPALVDKYRNKPGAENDVEYSHNNPGQAAMLETLDKSIGTLMRKLKELNLEEKTLVVFFSDNGQLGPKDSKPLRGSKADLYEGGIRVPMIVRWPGVIRPGSESAEPVISNDFLPTFCDVAGVKPNVENLDGISLLPILENPTTKLEREAIYFHFPHYHEQGLGPQSAIRQGKYKLIEYFERVLLNRPEPYELFDLESDLNEQENLVDAQPALAEELKNNLKSWRQKVGAQEMTIREK